MQQNTNLIPFPIISKRSGTKIADTKIRIIETGIKINHFSSIIFNLIVDVLKCKINIIT
jgi:hypothetical protein